MIPRPMAMLQALMKMAGTNLAEDPELDVNRNFPASHRICPDCGVVLEYGDEGAHKSHGSCPRCALKFIVSTKHPTRTERVLHGLFRAVDFTEEALVWVAIALMVVSLSYGVWNGHRRGSLRIVLTGAGAQAQAGSLPGCFPLASR